MDRQRLTFDQVRKIDRAGIEWKRWSEMTITCQGREFGCDWTGIAKDYEGHAKKCRLRKMSSVMSGAKRINKAYDNFLDLSRTNVDGIESIHQAYDDVLKILIRFRQVCETNDEHAILSAVNISLVSLRDLLDASTSKSYKFIETALRYLWCYQNNPEDETLELINGELIGSAKEMESNWARVLESCHQQHEKSLDTKTSVIEKFLFRSKDMIENKLTLESDLDELLKDIERLRSDTIGVRAVAIAFYEQVLNTE